MSTFRKIAAQAALIGGIAIAGVTAAAPADAGVVVGVGIGVPAHRHFCYRHPRACYGPRYYRPAYYGPAYVGPRIGVFYTGRGWWDGHRYWGHRLYEHGGWRYR